MDFLYFPYYNGNMKGVLLMADIKEQVEEVLEKLRPFLLRDGGDCEPNFAY